jgi:hypothetical protein
LYADPDPDPTAQINADPCGSGSETLLFPVYDQYQKLKTVKTVSTVSRKYITVPVPQMTDVDFTKQGHQ